MLSPRARQLARNQVVPWSRLLVLGCFLLVLCRAQQNQNQQDFSACPSGWTCRPSQVSSACSDGSCTEAQYTSLSRQGGLSASGLTSNGKYEFRFAKFVNTESASNGGGAIYTGYGTGVTIVVKRCAFVGCKCGQYKSGGAIYIYNGGHATITDTSFRNNLAWHSNGGAIYIQAGTLVIVNCAFISNTIKSVGSGGAVDMRSRYENSGGSLTMTNCTFANNQAISGDGDHVKATHREF